MESLESENGSECGKMMGAGHSDLTYSQMKMLITLCMEGSDENTSPWINLGNLVGVKILILKNRG